ncbi:MAG: phosphoribosylanthranilate isomerase [Candidatus Hadarchaeum sp.]|uniref:phosphoribosylanthranilate isomerase n=1 Tax=Candidatus Hadarchaeum sp. TaxID=2883567 RepID=UPI00317B5F1E
MTKIKICGFTRVGDVKIACRLGVDMVGVILIPQSSRHVNIDQASKIFDKVDQGVARVAVFLPRCADDVKNIYEKLRPDILQFQLTFSTEELLKLRKELDARVMTVVSVPQKIGNFEEIIHKALLFSEGADFLLIDTEGPSGGGTGLPHNWNLSASIRKVVKRPVFLAGGLTPTNVAQAIKIVRPYGVDVATGVESSPRRKDPKLMQEFLEAVRKAERS